MTPAADPHPGDSQVQREAETLMVAWLADLVGCVLEPKRITLPDGSWFELDAYCADPLVICEAWAHQGQPKSAQKMKVMNDAMKLLAARRVVGGDARAILLFADEAAASGFHSGTWRASALAEAAIEIQVAVLPPGVSESIRTAQERQYR